MEFLCRIDWVAISAIATLCMAVVTFFALRQNKKQLNELTRQWRYEHSARLDFNIEVQRHMYCLKVQNAGKSVAEIKSIEINDEFLKIMPQRYRVHLEKALCWNTLRIASGVTKFYWLCLANFDNVADNEKKDYLSLISTPIKIKTIFADDSVQEFEFTIGDYLYLGEAFTIESDVAIALSKIETKLESLFKKHIKIP